MNVDLFMAADLKNTGKDNLFVIFGKPDINILEAATDQVRAKLNSIVCWFIDTDYIEESFFVRHAYFLGANDPYKSLKVEINEEASWAQS